ncbi:AbrB/MazE/SpoVT family DNA-binding domain-containing protein [uncultured Pseudacidovorax sp.]|uniref:AbrB/MazE/SpoVT family DNA-binding domain-containing protein n=1 Tax=uncultured Pseudacidovorax sp. TaxID=679313 RepID=UPI0025FDFBFF|nr:AbrB/MazE/SpoVT family DNA-binding domain-containing protein [uncultured Pseudacidovorax sp.]
MFKASMTSKGRITIPASMRRQMRLNTGDRVVFTPLDDGTTVIRAKTRSLKELRGLLKPERDGQASVDGSEMEVGVLK